MSDRFADVVIEGARRGVRIVEPIDDVDDQRFAVLWVTTRDVPALTASRGPAPLPREGAFLVQTHDDAFAARVLGDPRVRAATIALDPSAFVLVLSPLARAGGAVGSLEVVASRGPAQAGWFDALVVAVLAACDDAAAARPGRRSRP